MSSFQDPTSSMIVELTDSPYPINSKESAIYVDTPTQSTVGKETNTPPKNISNERSPSSKGPIHRSPYSPSRNQIPPLPVPENMDIQLKTTIPNSKKRFDINKLVFTGDNSGAALDELKSMLESIQDALVNIVERSKGNSSHIQLFGTQLKEFNETFKQRQENENDLLTTSSYKAGQDAISRLLDELRSRLDMVVGSDESSNSDTIKQSMQDLTSELLNKLNAISSVNQLVTTSLSSIETTQQELLRSAAQKDLQESIKSLRGFIISNNDNTQVMDQLNLLVSKFELGPLFEKLKLIDSKQDEINGRISAKTESSNNSDVISALNDMNYELKKMAENTRAEITSGHEALSKQNSENYMHLLKQSDDLISKFDDFVSERQALDSKLKKLENENQTSQEDHARQLRDLSNQLLAKDEQLEKVKKQQTEDSMKFLEDKLNNLKIQELQDQLKQYELKEELQMSTMELINKSFEHKTVISKLELEIELKSKLLAQISTAYEAKLDKYIHLSNKFEELKLKTDSYISMQLDKQLINNLKFDMRYDQVAPPTSSSSSEASNNHNLKIQKRNVTLNESMLSMSSKLSPVDMNSYTDMYIKTQPEKRKMGLQIEQEIGAPDPSIYHNEYSSPQKKKVHINDFNKENQN